MGSGCHVTAFAPVSVDLGEDPLSLNVPETSRIPPALVTGSPPTSSCVHSSAPFCPERLAGSCLPSAGTRTVACGWQGSSSNQHPGSQTTPQPEPHHTGGVSQTGSANVGAGHSQPEGEGQFHRFKSPAMDLQWNVRAL